MSEVKRCANAACSCIPPEKEKYCSAHCEGMVDSVEVLCGCGHDSCRGAVTEPVISESAVEFARESPIGLEGTVEPGGLPGPL
jgi:hypothetical protein